jgi:hypothetical protein
LLSQRQKRHSIAPHGSAFATTRGTNSPSSRSPAVEIDLIILISSIGAWIVPGGVGDRLDANWTPG